MAGFKENSEAMGSYWRSKSDARLTRCAHPDCAPCISSQDQMCIGELAQPEEHDGALNTHRLCLHGAKDDGEWTFDLQINQGDAWNIWRLLGSVFQFRGVSRRTS